MSRLSEMHDTTREEKTTFLQQRGVCWALAAAIAVAAIAVYAPMTRAWFVADDFAWLNDAAYFCRYPGAVLGRDFAGLVRPTLHVTFALNYCLFGECAPGYYWTNIALHALNACLLLLLIARLGGGIGLAALSALLFALAAPHWRATAWIAARPEGLVTAFVLATVLAFQRWRVTGSGKWYAATIAFLILALGSKETAVCVAPLLIATEKLIYGGVRWRAHAPVWLGTAAWGAATFANSRATAELRRSFGVGFHVLDQMRDALVRIWLPLTGSGNWSRLWETHALIVVVSAVAAVTGVLALAVLGNRWQRLGLAWAVLALLPYSLDRRDPVFPWRYMYLASAGAQMVVAASVLTIYTRVRIWPARAAVAVATAALLCFHVAAVRPRLAQWSELSQRLRWAAEHKPGLPAGRSALVLVNLRYGRWYLNHLYGRVPPYAIVDIEGREPAILVTDNLPAALRRFEAAGPSDKVRVIQHEPLGFPAYRPLASGGP